MPRFVSKTKPCPSRAEGAAPITLRWFHVPAVAKAFMRPWKTIFRDGIVEHPLKELCRVYVSKTIDCDY